MLNQNNQFRRGFTIMEMIVSIGILVMVILSVGVIFQNAGRTVGVSQASMEMLSNARAINQQFESDVSGIDRDTFLVIRCANYTDPATGATRRCDQLSFISRGSFVNRTGTSSGFTDNNTTVPAAFVWWGQLAIANLTGFNPTDPADPRTTNPTSYLNASDQNYKVLPNQVPTGATEADLVLGRHTTLLTARTVSSATSNYITPCASSIGSYPSSGNLAAIDYSAPSANVFGITAEGVADITQSRVSAAQATPPQIMLFLLGTLGLNRSAADARYEADHFCYRYAALRSPADGLNLVNGYFRMHPIALQGVSSFIVDWTDGSVYTPADVGVTDDVTTGEKIATSQVNTTKWYGMYDRTKGASKGIAFSTDADTSIVDRGISGTTKTVTAANGDKYAAVFSYDNKVSQGITQWPVALRIRYHIADPTGRLQGGRDFVQVVKLPD